MEPTVEAQGVVKKFGRVRALDGLDLVIEPGAVVSILGPNGAGKTTFVRTLATLLRPDRGTVRVTGHDVVSAPREVRAAIGLAGQHAAVEEAMTGRENLAMVGELYGLRRTSAKARAQAVLDQLVLGEVGDRLVRTYSGGQRRRLDLGASLVGEPRVLLLDEPTTGLDPRSRIELWDAIRQLAGQGTDVLLTTQYLEEADQLAARIVIIDRGRVIADGSPDDLKTRAGQDVMEVHAHDASDLPDVVHALAPLGTAEPVVDAPTRRVSVTVEHGSASLRVATQALDNAGIAFDDVALRRPTLDEVFLALTGPPVAPEDAHDYAERKSA